LSFTDHVPLSKLFHPILRFNTTDCADPSRGETTLFLLRSEVDGFLPFRPISPTVAIACIQTQIMLQVVALANRNDMGIALAAAVCRAPDS
jgi:hypothetical protein